MIRTPLCDLLRVDTPIVQAPIGSASTPELAAAVSNAGALGTLALSWTAVEEVAARVEATRALTDRAFGANLVLAWPQHERLRRCLDAGAPVVSTAWGDPSSYVGDVHAAGAVHLHMVGSAEEALAAVEAGVDGVVAQGWEAGGHVCGEVATSVLVPAVVDAVGDVPVIAAGGIADGRGIAASLALGASGAWLGTRFLLAEEALIHDTYRDLLMRSRETGTFYPGVFNIGWDAPHRTLRNSTLEAWENAGRPAVGARPGEGEVVARRPGEEVVRYSDVLPLPDLEGDVEALPMYAGQSAGLVETVLPAAKIVEELRAETIETIRSLGGLTAD
jgi:nitronate monooxygenase